MRISIFLLCLLIPCLAMSQLFEMPSPKAVAKNKFTTLELLNGNDSTHKAFAWYRFDSKGRIVYENKLRAPGEKPYYTVYTYDKRGRKATATDRYENGTFFKRIAYTWLKDSIRIEAMYLNPKDSNELSMKYWVGPPPRNVVRCVIGYSPDGKERMKFGSIYDKKGKLIGNFDSSGDKHVMTECIYYKYKQVRTYDSTGKLLQIITLGFDTAGYINSVTDSTIAARTAQHYTIARTRETGTVVSKNKIPLTDAERLEWSEQYGQFHYNDAVVTPVLAPLPPNCYPITATYDETGLIRQAVVNNSCYPGMEGYPWTVTYSYAQ